MSVAFIVPIVALGAAYLISADSKKLFSNSSNGSNSSSNNKLESFLEDVPAEKEGFDNKAATDLYVTQNKYQTGPGNEIYSLTGKYMDVADFKHKNMVPFYGGKLKGQIYGNNKAEGVLDNMVGAGSQMFHKVEQAPLFTPEENVQWANGMPNATDFIKSRINSAMATNNVKPFDSERVGPGLNKGYTTEGSGGYNSILEARESYMPKSVDELRVMTNPKLETNIEEFQGPSNSVIKNIGSIGRVEKNRPDTFFIQTQDRWFTTTGQEKAPTLRADTTVVMTDTTRNNQSSEYIGVAGRGDTVSDYAPRNFKTPKKQAAENSGITPSCAVNRGPEDISKKWQMESIKNYSNNRTTTRAVESFGSGFTTAIGAVISPLMDILNPTRRQEASKNIRIYGDAGTTVPENYLMNPNDTPAVTIKETTLFTPPLGIPTCSNNAVGGYIVTDQQPFTNQRGSTTDALYFGDAGGGSTRWGGSTACNSIQTINEGKEHTLQSRINQGNMAIYNEPEINFSISKNDCDRRNPRMWVPTNLPSKFVTQDMMTDSNTRRPMCYDTPERNQPDLLNAFRQNPYTQSLSSVA
jgi:hypothetical protein